jgi:hypothetical protein
VDGVILKYESPSIGQGMRSMTLSIVVVGVVCVVVLEGVLVGVGEVVVSVVVVKVNVVSVV